MPPGRPRWVAVNFFSPDRASSDTKRLELAMERRALHADEFRGPRDIAGEAADLGDQVVALEHLARLAQRQPHDVLAIVAGRHRRDHRTYILRQHVGGDDDFGS